MEIVEIRAMDGPNIYSPKSIIKMTVDVKELENVATREIPGFNSTAIISSGAFRTINAALTDLADFDSTGEGTYFPMCWNMWLLSS